MDLPNEMIEYILNIVICDGFFDNYTGYSDAMSLPFSITLKDSPMSTLMMELSNIHPKFKKILRKKCVFFDARWRFKKQKLKSIKKQYFIQ